MLVLNRLCDIIQDGMDLSRDQVYIWDQKINIPTDNRLYVAVGITSCKPFSSIRTMSVSGGVVKEVLTTNFQATCSIDALSRSKDALNRKEEIVMSLNSTYSQQVQEANGFHIARIPSSFVNLSEVEGAAIPYRFSATVNVLYKQSKENVIDYYDDFSLDEILTEG